MLNKHKQTKIRQVKLKTTNKNISTLKQTDFLKKNLAGHIQGKPIAIFFLDIVYLDIKKCFHVCLVNEEMRKIENLSASEQSKNLLRSYPRNYTEGMI